MLECYDQDELLAYIEDTLAPVDAARLKARLAKDPAASELIEAMRRDRMLLVADPEPQLPVDFAAQLESLLVRPMLMEPSLDLQLASSTTRPGRERRRQRRHRRLRAARRLAMAATIAVVAIGGAWAVFQSLSLDSLMPTVATAPEQIETEIAIQPHVQAALDAWGDDSSIVHHHYPLQIPGPHTRPEDRLAHSRPSDHDADSIRTANFILVLRAADTAKAEQTLVQIVGELEMPAALVQNFSFEEARSLEQDWLMVQRNERRRNDATAGASATTSPERLAQLAERATDQHRRSRPNLELSMQLVGSSELAASFSQQLEFSSRDATHTLTLPLHQLQDLLALLAKTEGLATLLRPFPEPSDEESSGFHDRAMVQEALRELVNGEDSLVHLPIRLVK